jgi:hypothetical protein
MQLVDGLAGETQQRGQQGERGQEDHQHGGDAGGRQPDHVGLPDEEQSEARGCPRP